MLEHTLSVIHYAFNHLLSPNYLQDAILECMKVSSERSLAHFLFIGYENANALM